MKISLNGVSGQWHALMHRDLTKVAAAVAVTIAAGVAAAVAVAVAVAAALALAVALAGEAQQFYFGLSQLYRHAMFIEQPYVR